PENATDKVVLWTSSDPLVASVDRNGNVTALSEGTADIIARTLEPSDKQFTARCKISVTGTIHPSGNIIEAEDYDVQSGINTEECSEGGSDVAYIENGDYIGFKGVNFGRGSSSINLRIGSNGSKASIEVHIGSPDGKLIGSMEVNGTGGWQKWATQTCKIEPMTGVSDVYFVFKGDEGYLYNLNWFSINYPYENDDLMGDCNLDGAVSIADAVMLQNWILGRSDKLNCWRHADVCTDKIIDVFDLCLLKTMVVEQGMK
ncbi:MAG: carbohydrate-binding protein, partial [Ruminococcus sp.]|nr:carbohydrate-binding protein [Ruminococcus sp.]